MSDSLLPENSFRILPSKKTLRSFILTVLAVIAGLVGLWWSLCAPLDITDDPGRNGGYGRGMVFVTEVPIYVFGNQYAVSEREREGRGNSYVSIPAGCRLQIIKVIYIREITADNIFRAQPLARWMDGPLAGKDVYLQGISLRTPMRYTTIDPSILLLASAGETTAAKAAQIIASLPETRVFEAELGQVGRKLVIMDETGASSTAFQFYVGEDAGDHTAIWNRFRVDRAIMAITVWVATDDNWVSLEDWRKIAQRGGGTRP